MTDQPDEQGTAPTEHHLDVDAERRRLDDLKHRIDEVRDQAGEDLEPGGEGRILPDVRMHREAIEHGDAPLHEHHEPASPPD